MRTPAGKECRHYFQDFHRGKDVQECRLVKANPASMYWKPMDCSKCPVPDILNANASRDLNLKVTIQTKFLGFGREVKVEASCKDQSIPLEEAYTGCNDKSHPGLDLFRQALDSNDDD